MNRRSVVSREFRSLVHAICLVLVFFHAGFACAQTPAVNVTMTADNPVLIPGQTTTIRVFARIDPSIEAAAVGIFSWYIDVLNSDGAVAVADYDNLTMTSSDNVPATSDSGTTDGAYRRGINNTFFFWNPTAGKGISVELLAVQVTAGQPGVTTLSVAEGTTVPSSAGDFLVDPIAEGAPQFTGGNYAAASDAVKVISVSEAIKLGIERPVGGGAELSFTPIAGYDHTVMFSENLSPGSWVALPGAPHNDGSLTDPALGVPRRFYLVQVTKK